MPRHPLLLTVLAILHSLAAPPAIADVTPGSLLIYYGWPSGINGTFAVEPAAAEFARYDVVVLGDGLEKTDHPDHANSVAILALVHASASTQVFGYVDLGVSTQNLPLAELTLRVDEWLATGADGVFFDDFGYDYGTDRTRQNAAVAYAHGLALPVIANGWNPDDVFGDQVDPLHNPAGEPTQLGVADFYLSESYQVAVGAYQSEAAWIAKANQLDAYRTALGFGVLSITTNDAANVYSERAFFYAWHSALLWGHAATGWGEYLFAASTGSAPYRERPAVDAGAAFLSAVADASPEYTRDTEAGRVMVNAAAHGYAFVPWSASVEEPLDAAAGGLALAASPNPSRGGTTLHFTLPTRSLVTVTLYDVTGRQAGPALRLAPREAGEHSLRLERGALPSGVYVCTLRAQGRSGSVKLVLD